MCRSHQRVADVVATAGQGTEANQLSATDLCLVATDSVEIGMAQRESHLRPGIQHRPGLAATASDVGLVGLVVVEEIEFDEFDTLQLQLIERAVDPLRVGADQLGIGQNPRRSLRCRIAGGPIVRPIQPRPLPETLGTFPSEATSSGLRHLPQESLFSGLCHRLNIALKDHLCAIFRGVHKDSERAVPRAPAEHTDPRHDRQPRVVIYLSHRTFPSITGSDSRHIIGLARIIHARVYCNRRCSNEGTRPEAPLSNRRECLRAMCIDANGCAELRVRRGVVLMRVPLSIETGPSYYKKATRKGQA